MVLVDRGLELFLLVLTHLEVVDLIIVRICVLTVILRLGNTLHHLYDGSELDCILRRKLLKQWLANPKKSEHFMNLEMQVTILSPRVSRIEESDSGLWVDHNHVEGASVLQAALTDHFIESLLGNVRDCSGGSVDFQVNSTLLGQALVWNPDPAVMINVLGCKKVCLREFNLREFSQDATVPVIVHIA